MRYIILPIIGMLYFWWCYESVIELYKKYHDGEPKEFAIWWLIPHSVVIIMGFIYLGGHYIIPYCVNNW